MNKYKESIILKSLIITLVITLLVPSFVKLAHAFKNHKHEICVTPQKSHFHENDLDCEFYKFKLNKQYFSLSKYSELVIYSPCLSKINTLYSFIDYYNKLSFSLRAPPVLG